MNDFSKVNQWIEEKNYDELLQWAIQNHDEEDAEIIRKVFECLQMCVKQEMPVAALNLGTFYYTGRGVKQDFKKAFDLYKIAADAGIIRAICNCGYCYFYGRHQAPDYAKAFEYFAKGAFVCNDPNCLYKLGDMYLGGLYVPKDEQYAFALYNKAMETIGNMDDSPVAGDVEFRLGKCFLHGIGTEQNIETAYFMLSVALSNFYRRRKSDVFVGNLIREAKNLIEQIQEKFDQETC